MEIAEEVARRLADEGLLPDGGLAGRMRAALLAWGAELAATALPGWDAARIEAAAAPLRPVGPFVERVLGFGHQQGDALAQLVGGPRAEAARLSGLLNLGVVLYDGFCDHVPARLPSLLAYLDEAGLARLARDPAALPAATGDDGVDLTVALFGEVLAGAARLGGDDRALAELHRVLATMQRAELATTHHRRSKTPPSLGVLRDLRRKSALPFWAMALLALRARGGGGDASLRAVVGLAGDAMWMADDLCDLDEDWQRDVWSRPWWLLGRSDGAPLGDDLADGEAARARLRASGLVELEATRLAARLARLGRTGGRAVAVAVGVAVRAWLQPDR